MNRRQLTALALTALVGAVGCSDQIPSPVAPAASPELSAAVLETPSSQMVVFKGNHIPEGFAERVAELGGTVELVVPRIGIASVSGLSDGALTTLSADAGIEAIEPEEVLPLVTPVAKEQVTVADALSSAAAPGTARYHYLQWHLRQIGAPAAWAAGQLGSPDVTVGIIDTGLDYVHPDLSGLVDLARSRSFLPTEDAILAAYLPTAHKVFDLHGHGTHVGATVSSNANITAGVTSRVKLVGLKVCRSEIPGLSAGGCPATATFAAIVYAAENGIDVVNMSLGGLFLKRGANGYTAAINRVFNYARQQKLTIVVAAGNDNVDLDHHTLPELDEDGNETGARLRYPSLYGTYCDAPNVVCVSATGPANAANSQSGPWFDIDSRAPYSNFGRSAISVAAPGGTGKGLIWAACPTIFIARTVAPAPGVPAQYQAFGDAYCRSFPIGMGGTSMAAPHVTALAALMVEKHGRNPSAVANAIRKSADDLGQPGNDPIYGKGRINVRAALGL